MPTICHSKHLQTSTHKKIHTYIYLKNLEALVHLFTKAAVHGRFFKCLLCRFLSYILHIHNSERSNHFEKQLQTDVYPTDSSVMIHKCEEKLCYCESLTASPYSSQNPITLSLREAHSCCHEARSVLLREHVQICIPLLLLLSPEAEFSNTWHRPYASLQMEIRIPESGTCPTCPVLSPRGHATFSLILSTPED